MNSNAIRRIMRERDTRLIKMMQCNHTSMNPNTSQNDLIPSILNLSMPLSFSIDERAQTMSIAREENKVETEVIHIIPSGNIEHLRPNSGDAVNVAGHNICIGFTKDDGYDEQVWEWHGHIVLYEELEFMLEYFYGFYNEKLPKKALGKGKKKGDHGGKGGGNVGLMRLMRDGGSAKGRILRQNQLGMSSDARKIF